MQGGRKMTMRRHFLKRRKVMEEIGPQMFPPDVELNDNVKAAAQDGSAGNREVKLDNSFNDRSLLDAATDQLHHHSGPTPLLSPTISNPKDSHASLSNTPRFEESLTQPSTVPASEHSRTTDHTPAHPTNIPQELFKSETNIALSQQSLTQPSSTPSLSPAPARALEDMLHSAKEVAQPKVFVLDSPVR